MLVMVGKCEDRFSCIVAPLFDLLSETGFKLQYIISDSLVTMKNDNGSANFIILPPFPDILR